ncbi:ATP-binding protein [Thermodesulfobacteriota bacterium]
MNNSQIKNNNFTKYSLVAVFVWTFLIAALLIFQKYHLHSITKGMAVSEARTHFKKDQAFRYWGNFHGGVYVPITDKTVPNPYLAHIKERDIKSTSGKKLTLINPAYMVRQMSEMFAGLYGASGHITSLKLMRPENAPDEWERRALLAFEENNEIEVKEFLTENGKQVLRLMKPLYIDEGCLKCHDKQGYKIGSVRGGISVTIDMPPYHEREYKQFMLYVLMFNIIWGVGLLGIFFGISRLKLRRKQRDDAYYELERYKKHLEDLIKERTLELETANITMKDHIHEIERMNDELMSFSDVVSHDLKSPLTSIIGMADLLMHEDSFEDTEKIVHFLDRITSNGRIMNTIINDLTEWSRIGREEKAKEDIPVGDMIKNIIHDNILKVNELGAKVEVEENLPTLYFSRARLYQVFSNLIRNALKFLREDVTAEIKIGSKEEDREYIINISDNGIGIEKKYLSEIFLMFSRLKDVEVEGTGAGLAIVKKILEESGGRIWVESKKGEGTTFFVAIKKKPTTK